MEMLDRLEGVRTLGDGGGTGTGLDTFWCLDTDLLEALSFFHGPHNSFDKFFDLLVQTADVGVLLCRLLIDLHGFDAGVVLCG